VRFGEEEPAVEEGQVGRDDDLTGSDRARLRLDQTLALVHFHAARARELEDVASVARNRGGKGEHVLARVKLGLVVHARRSGDGKR